MADSMWYDVNRTLSHNCLFNFVVGPRGVGKTYSCKRRVIQNWLKKRQQFIYVRRYETEIDKKIGKFFDDIRDEFRGTDMYVKGNQFMIDDEVAGWVIPLSKSAQFKSVPFPYVTMILFDEFIIDTGLIRYLPREVDSFLELYSTIARLRDVIVLFLSNAITFTNPYFLYFDLTLQPGQTLMKKNDVLLELVKNEAYTEASKNTRFGRMLQGTDYGKYAMENEFLRDTDDFIESIPDAATSVLNIAIKGYTFTVYTCTTSPYWYVSDKIDRTAKLTVSLDMESHNEHSKQRKDQISNSWVWEIEQRFYRGNLRFTSLTVKNLLMEAFKRGR